MSAARTTTPPTSATAGDTWTWDDTHADYPAGDGWVLAYRIAGPVVLQWSSAWASVSGNTTTITIPATATLNLKAGRYSVFAEYTLSGERHTEALNPLTVAANPATLTANATQTWEEKTLEAIECFLSGNLANGVQYYMIGTRQVQSIPVKDLMQIRDRLRQDVANQAAPAGSGFGRAVKWRNVVTT